MAKYRFSAKQRYAIFTVHGEKCYQCKKPIDLTSMHVDHVIPESLLNTPERLKEVLVEMGLPADFNLNSYANWLPSCAKCNIDKGAEVFEPTPLIQRTLSRAATKTEQVVRLVAEIVREAEIAELLNSVERAGESGALAGHSEAVARLVKWFVPFHIRHRAPEMVDQPIHLGGPFEVLSDNGRLRITKGPYGVGYQPSGNQVHSSFSCPTCGMSAGWNGAICVGCGQLNDD
ncbi:HNH endonuclease [Zoogloea sp. LCSB751]|uniref:HNH endonuclease n=1 Tax=Zoogloea sp. LCSB751 TaxID=1965277 RepID=UPI001115D216|nr:HNH endonuclease [Zoogloea sp. LCSB751]